MSDLHANPLALAAVLADAETQSVVRWLVLGDVVPMGPGPVAVLELLDTIDVVATVSGNGERYVLQGDRPGPSFEQVAADSSLLPRLAEVAATFAWTRGYLTAVDRLEGLRNYADSYRAALPDGTQLLAVHASMVSDEGRGITPSLTAADVAELFPDHGADVVLGGHTHYRTDEVVAGVRFVNPGSVSNHHGSMPATYSILDVAADAHTFEHRDVSYDKAALVQAIRASGIPGGDFLVNQYFPDVLGTSYSEAK